MSKLWIYSSPFSDLYGFPPKMERTSRKKTLMGQIKKRWTRSERDELTVATRFGRGRWKHARQTS